ncbi:hypothetical protein [Streptomyces sp. STR69]|uniref:hypothetical protein n=1 Tax=Streptomyces sp. STR69 TaxID=1796942 RepID=UPI0021C850A4|nr:hypothetical protein [Streptomyces sp. STR69]
MSPRRAADAAPAAPATRSARSSSTSAACRRERAEDVTRAVPEALGRRPTGDERAACPPVEAALDLAGRIAAQPLSGRGFGKHLWPPAQAPPPRPPSGTPGPSSQ